MTALALAVAGVMATTAHLRCVDAAREAARLIARGDSALAQEAATKIAPAGAHLRITTDGDHISVEVSVTPVGELLPNLVIAGEAFAIAEPETPP
nr:hypothetical protein [Kibdelosporangium sp. MJ126-NF4]CTQ94373.1 hypothetical protein [Kibdelosporangium sp. MJ126-NF4]